MKTLQADVESLEVEKVFTVTRVETKLSRPEAITRIQGRRRNLERLARYKRMTGTASALSLCISMQDCGE